MELDILFRASDAEIAAFVQSFAPTRSVARLLASSPVSAMEKPSGFETWKPCVKYQAIIRMYEEHGVGGERHYKVYPTE